MNELALFAGAGGGILGGKLLGWRTVCAVETDEYCRYVLIRRQNEGHLAPFPIWDDVRTFDGRPWRGVVDVVSGGFPCQDISAAGKGAGIEGKRSGLWSEFARIIGEIRPHYVFVENSPMLTIRGGLRVVGDLTEMVYDSKGGIVGADDVGAPHRRKRIWIVADTESSNDRGSNTGEGGGQVQQSGIGSSAIHVSNSCGPGRQRGEQREALFCDGKGPEAHGPIGQFRCSWWDEDPAEVVDSEDTDWRRADGEENQRGRTSETGGPDKHRSRKEHWPTQSGLGRVAHGVAHRVDRLKAIGNGQVPAVAATAWRILTKT